MPLTPTPDAEFRTVPPALEREPILTAPVLAARQLANGLEVAVVERPELPLVTLAYASRLARDDGTPERAGLAYLTAHAVHRRAERALPDGAVVDAKIDVDSNGTLMTISGLVDDANAHFAALGAALENHTFDPGLVRGAANTARESIDRRASRLGSTLRRAAKRELYGDEHVLAEPADARENLARFEVADVQAFHAERYAPNGSLLLVVGAIEAGRMLELAERTFGDWPSSPPKALPPAPAPAPPPPARRRAIQAFSKRAGSAYAVVATPCPALGSPDRLAFELIATELRRVTQSEFATAVRHQGGTTYAWDSRCAARAEGGTLVITADAEPGRLANVLEAILTQIARLPSEPLGHSQFEAAQMTLLAQRARAMLSNQGLARELGRAHLAVEPFAEHATTLEARVLALTPESVRGIAARYLSPERVGIAVAGDDRRFPAQLSLFGPWNRARP